MKLKNYTILVLLFTLLASCSHNNLNRKPSSEKKSVYNCEVRSIYGGEIENAKISFDNSERTPVLLFLNLPKRNLLIELEEEQPIEVKYLRDREKLFSMIFEDSYTRSGKNTLELRVDGDEYKNIKKTKEFSARFMYLNEQGHKWVINCSPNGD